MGAVTNICSREQSQKISPSTMALSITKTLLKRNRGLAAQSSQQNNVSCQKKQLINSLNELFPCRYLGNGIYGTILQVFTKAQKQLKYAYKIIPQQNLQQDYLLFHQKQLKSLFDDPILKNKLVKVHYISLKYLKYQDDQHLVNNDDASINKTIVVMDLMKKGDLYHHLNKVKKKNSRFFPFKAIKRIAKEMIQFLDRLHNYHRMTFRNMRPQNIFIRQDGTLAISDYIFSLNQSISKTYYGAAEYAPPQVFRFQQAKKNERQLIKNIQVEQAASPTNEYKQLRRSPDVRRIKFTNELKSKSVDLRDLKYFKYAPPVKQKQNNLLVREKNMIPNLESKQVAKVKQQCQKQQQKKLVTKSGRLTPNILPRLFDLKKQCQPHGQQKLCLEISQTIHQKDHSSPHTAGFLLNKKTIQIYQSEEDYLDDDQDEEASDTNWTIDFWMLGVMLFQLVNGSTPFQKCHTINQTVNKTPTNTVIHQQSTLQQLRKMIRNQPVSQLWIDCPNSSSQINSISDVQKDFIQQLLIKQVSDRASISSLRKHPFLKDVDMHTKIEQLIYEQNYDKNRFEKQTKQYLNKKYNGLIPSRTILRRTGQHKPFQPTHAQMSFQHQI